MWAEVNDIYVDRIWAFSCPVSMKSILYSLLILHSTVFPLVWLLPYSRLTLFRFLSNSVVTLFNHPIFASALLLFQGHSSYQAKFFIMIRQSYSFVCSSSYRKGASTAFWHFRCSSSPWNFHWKTPISSKYSDWRMNAVCGQRQSSFCCCCCSCAKVIRRATDVVYAALFRDTG